MPIGLMGGEILNRIAIMIICKGCMYNKFKGKDNIDCIVRTQTGVDLVIKHNKCQMFNDGTNIRNQARCK